VPTTTPSTEQEDTPAALTALTTTAKNHTTTSYTTSLDLTLYERQRRQRQSLPNTVNDDGTRAFVTTGTGISSIVCRSPGYNQCAAVGFKDRPRCCHRADRRLWVDENAPAERPRVAMAARRLRGERGAR
jgi:hypothetical protein